MGASKYTDAERVTVLGLYVENFALPGIVAATGLDRKSVTSILGNMYSKAQLHRAPTYYHCKAKARRIHYAAPESEPTPFQPGH